MAGFSLFGGTPGFGYFGGGGSAMTRRYYGERPGLDELLGPDDVEPEYPTAPARIRRSRDLPKGDKRQLTMALLANLAAAIGGAEKGRLGTNLARAAGANIQAEQQVLDTANASQDDEYRRQRAEAEQVARQRQAAAQRDRQRQDVEALLQMGDQAIEAAGGADADPTHAARVYSAVRTRNLSYLQKLMDEAPGRRSMRDIYGVDPDDPQAVDELNATRERAQKSQELRELEDIRGERDTKTHRENRLFDVAHPTRDTKPDKPNIRFDSARGVFINEDTQSWSYPPAPLPPPANGKQYDEVETKAHERAMVEMRAYNAYNNAPQEAVRDASGKLVRRRKPFDFDAAYRAALASERQLQAENEAKADPSTGARGPAAKMPGRAAVQSPKGAPVGMGGGLVGRDQQPVKRSDQQKLADIEANVGKLTAAQQDFIRKQLAAGKLPREIVAEIRRRRGGG